tara:strand:+ start:7057 stop:7422 length:366 start_codon:yes stop_codon:yes gene_type:complete
MRDPSSPTKDDHRAGGGSNTPSAFEATYALEDEDHTLGNCLRFQLNKNPAVALAGYSVPHPMERKVNVRVQTIAPMTTDGAMRDALLDVVSVCEHVTETFEDALKTAAGKGKNKETRAART